jgi:hypothetical protein
VDKEWSSSRCIAIPIKLDPSDKICNWLFCLSNLPSDQSLADFLSNKSWNNKRYINQLSTFVLLCPKSIITTSPHLCPRHQVQSSASSVHLIFSWSIMGLWYCLADKQWETALDLMAYLLLITESIWPFKSISGPLFSRLSNWFSSGWGFYAILICVYDKRVVCLLPTKFVYFKT